MKTYKISKKTMAITPVNKRLSRVYETENVILVEQNANKIISDNCEYYGSSYEGRKKGTLELIGVTHKAPVIIEEQDSIIFFPTSSPRLNDCTWIALNNIDSYRSYANESIIRFINNTILQVNVSNKIIDNQVLRSTRLESVYKKRNIEKKEQINR